VVEHSSVDVKFVFVDEHARREVYLGYVASAKRLAGAEFARATEACVVKLSSNNGEIDRLRIQKIQRVGLELVFDVVDEASRADQVQRRGPVQTNPQQPIKTGKMIHMGM
jgi:hypothetical protein